MLALELTSIRVSAELVCQNATGLHDILMETVIGFMVHSYGAIFLSVMIEV